MYRYVLMLIVGGVAPAGSHLGPTTASKPAKEKMR